MGQQCAIGRPFGAPSTSSKCAFGRQYRVLFCASTLRLAQTNRAQCACESQRDCHAMGDSSQKEFHRSALLGRSMRAATQPYNRYTWAANAEGKIKGTARFADFA